MTSGIDIRKLILWFSSLQQHPFPYGIKQQLCHVLRHEAVWAFQWLINDVTVLHLYTAGRETTALLKCGFYDETK